MDGRSRNPVVGVVDAKAMVEQFKGYDKYLCGSCRQLRMGRQDVRSKNCGNCGSSNIDVESDLTSMRLEVLRMQGDPELRAKVMVKIAEDDVRRRK
jgi:hypothetical protein